MNQIDEQQRKRLADLFLKVKSSFDELPPYTIINRIMTIEGIDATRGTRGYQLMRNLGIIPDRFVKGGKEVEEKVVKTFFTPVMCDLMQRFGVVIEDMKFIRKDGEQVGLAFSESTSKQIADTHDQVKEANSQPPAADPQSLNIVSNFARSLKDSIADKLLGLDTDF
jgi:hypothetical protein